MTHSLCKSCVPAIFLVALLIAGCRHTIDSKEEQKRLATLYYSGEVESAAELAMNASDLLADSSSSEALLWHLEAGSSCLDAKRPEDAIRALNRAEKLIYLMDGHEVLYQRPGVSRYRGTRSDRLMLHLLKGFYYLSQNSIEDFLVEIRRLREEQFRYVYTESDPEIDNYEKTNSGKKNVVPLRMKSILNDSSRKAIFGVSGVIDNYTEYCQRRRPELPLLYNPLAFYLSSLGYCFDLEYQDAKIDLGYLLMMDPANRIYRSDMAGICKMLMDVPPALAKESDPLPDDQVVCVIWASGMLSGWKSRAAKYVLPHCVPTNWTYSYPEVETSERKIFSAKWKGGKSADSVHLADISEVASEEYWQLYFPKMIDGAYKTTVSVTAAHDAALVSLAAAQAIPDNYVRLAATAAAAATVAATSKANVKQEEWRRWITLPRNYAILNLRLPSSPDGRRLVIAPPKSFGEEDIELSFAADTNRAVVYIREIKPGICVVQNWESNE